jgi:predicted metal-binding membrane protein
LICASALLFVASAAVTLCWGASMSAMGGMPMPGGWTMSMTWMRMPGQTWLGAAASFLAMWIAMMMAMMLPSLVPTLMRYGMVTGLRTGSRSGRLTALVGLGYFVVWIAAGVAVYAIGIALATAVMRLPALARVVPAATGAVVFLAGVFQLSRSKARHLACWRNAAGHGRIVQENVRTAFRRGVRLGVQCSYGCAGLTASLLAVGVMDLRAMAVVTAAITAERLAPDGQRVARVIGAVGIAVGALLILHARAFT